MIEQEEKELTWPNKLYLLHENEMWLNEQAQKGLVLKSFVIDSANFIKTESKNIVYKVIILDDKKAENHVKLIQHQGFTFVGSYKEYYIFYIDGKYKHIYPRLNEEMSKVARRWFNKQIFIRFGGILIALISILINLIMDRDEILQMIVEMPTMWLVYLILILSILIIDPTKEYRALGRNKKYYLKNEFYITRKMGKKSISTYIMILASIFLTVSAIKYFYFKPEPYSIEEAQKFMPIVLLQDIEKDEKISKELKILQKKVSEENYVEINHTFLAPKQYTADQQNTYEDNSNGMSIHYYEVAFKILAEPLTRELIINKIFDITKDDLEEIEYDGLDKVYYYDGYIDFISVCKGNKVIYISYYGEKPVPVILGEIIKVL